jgi:ferredoxin
MTIFYFTSTGNSLAAAKAIDKARLISIPQILDDPKIEYGDDVIGIVFPIYGFGLPKMVRRFLEKASLAAEYIFALGTYGNMPGACMRNAQIDAAKRGIRIDYAESLLMVDNYLPGFEIKDQISKLPQKKTDENLARIVADIGARKKLSTAAPLGARVFTALIQAGEKLVMRDTQARNYIVNDNCIKCGICAKVCPSGNVTVAEKVTFADKCEWCLGCVHLCPQNAIHLKIERSSARWRHPDVSLAEIIKSNDRTAKK